MARERNLFGIYYISQYADDGQQLFANNGDRETFVSMLQEALKQYPSELLAYCLIEPTAYHLIVRFHGGDISQFMSSLNIRFALQTERSGLFRDRFHSELLNADADVHRVLDALEAKSRTADEWNSFCTADRSRGRTGKLNLAAERPDTFDMTQRSCISSEKGLRIWLDASLEAEGLTFEQVLNDKALRNEWIYRCRRMSCLTLKALGDVFGGISESMVSKIIKQGVHRA